MLNCDKLLFICWVQRVLMHYVLCIAGNVQQEESCLRHQEGTFEVRGTTTNWFQNLC
jgi:hypothetical protein